ncbi:substrate-binding periplasmic protein [Hahella ganghwensis]|uniref:substrate-binding periplasmic protein n=1 Tax=Hahella ganghwensis TaxID=286420 RepID=UPI0003A445E7|nr:ABC transporter substrate-binding protein [Hahella ganghwensis]
MVDGYYSDVVITFHNHAVSLKDRGLKIKRMEDLSQLSIVAFQRATFILGEDFARTVQYNNDYNEVADQSLQIKQLFRNRTDVIILEKRIFQYFRRWLYDRASILNDEYIVSRSDLRQPVVYHNIFSPSEYRFAFLSEQVRDDFNEGLRTIRENGTYDSIMSKYEEDLSLPKVEKAQD